MTRAFFYPLNVKRRNYIVSPEQGLNKTLELMKKLEREAVQNKQFNFFVTNSFMPYAEKFNCIYSALHSLILQEFTFQDDYPDELLTAPFTLMQTKRGDCDDFALFAKSVLSVLGIPSNYILFGKETGVYTHIAVTANGLIIDGTNKFFNQVPDQYKDYKIIE